MPPRITRVALTNYRSIRACEVELQPLTLLVGANGSGKSNFLDALRLLGESMHSPIEEVMATRSGLGSVLHRMSGGKRAASLSIQVWFELESGATGTYKLTLGEAEDAAFLIKKEECQVGGIPGFTSEPGRGLIVHSEETTPVFGSDRPMLAYFAVRPDFEPVYRLIAGMTFYAPNPEQMRTPRSIGPGRNLLRDAANAADVLSHIEKVSPHLLPRLFGYLEAFNPQFSSVSVTETETHRWLAFSPSSHPSNWRMSAADVSDGTLRAMGILLAIFQAGSGSRVSMVGVEEPESNLHPAAAGILLDALLEASLTVPIVASTHSADLLDRKDLSPEAILAVVLRDGESVIGPIDESGRDIIRRRLFTAGELMRSNQLTPAMDALVR